MMACTLLQFKQIITVCLLTVLASGLNANTSGKEIDNETQETSNNNANNAKYELKYVDTEEGKGYDLFSFDGSALRDEKWRFGSDTGFPVYNHRHAHRDGPQSPFHVVDARADDNGRYSKTYILNENIEKLLSERVHEPKALHTARKSHDFERRRPHKHNKTETVTLPPSTTTAKPYKPSSVDTAEQISEEHHQVPAQVLPQPPVLDPNVYQGIIGSLQSGIFPSYYPHIVSGPQGEQYGVWSFQGFGPQSPVQGVVQQSLYPQEYLPVQQQPEYGYPTSNQEISNTYNHPSYHPSPVTTEKPNYFATSPKPNPTTSGYRPNNGPVIIHPIGSYVPSTPTAVPPVSTTPPPYLISSSVSPVNTRPPHGTHHHHSKPSSNTRPTAYPITNKPQRPGYLGQTHNHRPGNTIFDNTDRPSYYGGQKPSTTTTAPPPPPPPPTTTTTKTTTSRPTTSRPHYYGSYSTTKPPVPTTDRPNYFGTSPPPAITTTNRPYYYTSTTTAAPAVNYFSISVKPPPQPIEIQPLPLNSTSNLVYNPIYIHAPNSGQININYGAHVFPQSPQKSTLPSTRTPTTTIISTTTTTQRTVYWPSSTVNSREPIDNFDIRNFNKIFDVKGLDATKAPSLFHSSEDDHRNTTTSVSASTEEATVTLPAEDEEEHNLDEEEGSGHLDNRIDKKIVKSLVG